VEALEKKKSSFLIAIKFLVNLIKLDKT